MCDPTIRLKELKATKEYFIGIDSDGCVFDTMEIKHKECFCPQYINHFGLQAVSKYAREVWDFVNLYSKTRGINRFKGIIRAVDLLAERKEVKTRSAEIPKLFGVREWTERETKLGNPALQKELEKNPHPDLKLAYQWSLDVNKTIQNMVKNIPPFPYVRECLGKIREKADAIIVSQTPFDALEREWKEHNLDSYVRIMAGQEMGTKSEQISFAAGNKYSFKKMLMIGDAYGDLKAAKENNALFFPIIPGKEEKSWQILYENALDKFFNGTYEKEYEYRLIEEFNKHLPENPFWKR